MILLPFGAGRHPASRLLQRMADGELAGPSRDRVRVHLERCPRCVERVRFYRELREATRQIRHPSPPKELLEEILDSRARGERAILPATAVPPRRPLPLRAAAVAAAVVLAFAAALILPTSEAAAGASELRFDPVLPAPGQLVAVEYRPSSYLAGAGTLWLRARYWTAGPTTESPASILRAPLERESSGVYRGSVRLPPSAVYALWAVEDADGERVDDRANRLWEVLASGGSGVPLAEALEQQFRVLEERNWRAATETARRLTEAYPDRPAGWAMLLEHERRVLTPDELQRRLPVYREVLRRLEARVLRTSPADADELVMLRRLAEQLGEADTADVLRRLLDESYPDHPDAIRDRISAIAVEAGSDRQRLERLEEEWDRFGTLSPVLVTAGFETARRLDDPQALLRWAERLERLGPTHAARAAVTLARTEKLRAEGIERLRAAIDAARELPDADRPLDETRAEFRMQADLVARRLQAELAAALVAEGRIAEGLAEASAAAKEAWDPELFERAHEAARRAGDRAAERRYAALLALDPWTDDARVDELEAAHAAEPAWADAVAEAHRQLRNQLRRVPDPPRPFPDGIRVVDRGGAIGDLAERLRGRTTLVAFWHRRSWPFKKDLESLRALAGRFRQAPGGTGPEVLAVSLEPPGAAVEAFLEAHEMPFGVVFDLEDASASVLGVWSAPEYFVVDREGRIRLRTYDVAAAGRLVAAAALEAAADPDLVP